MANIGDKIFIIEKHPTFNNLGEMDRYIGKILTVTGKFGRHSTALGWTWHEDCYINITELLQSNVTEKDIMNALCGKVDE